MPYTSGGVARGLAWVATGFYIGILLTGLTGQHYLIWAVPVPFAVLGLWVMWHSQPVPAAKRWAEVTKVAMVAACTWLALQTTNNVLAWLSEVGG
jgi:hypothetical protein